MNPQTLWYLSRATGIVALLLFTGSMVLGVASTGRAGRGLLPRSGVQRLHRNLSLTAIAFLTVHIVSAIVDGYVDLHPLDAFVPFISGYDPLWTGFGAVAVDLTLAVTITSLLRRHLSARAWRLVHLTSYALWPVAVVHGLGSSGGDTARGWMIGIYLGCAALLLCAVGIWRLRADRHPDSAARAVGDARYPAVVPGDGAVDSRGGSVVPADGSYPVPPAAGGRW